FNAARYSVMPMGSDWMSSQAVFFPAGHYQINGSIDVTGGQSIAPNVFGHDKAIIDMQPPSSNASIFNCGASTQLHMITIRGLTFLNGGDQVVLTTIQTNAGK